MLLSQRVNGPLQECWVSSRLTPGSLEWSLVDMRRLGDPLRWLERGKFFGGCAPVKRQGEAFVVVSALPASESFRGRLEVLEAVPPPELLVVDPMAPLDFAVLLRSPGPNVSVADPGGLDPEHEGKRELLPMVALHSFDGERKGPLELSEEREARAVMQTSVQPQDAEARAVVQGGVLKRPTARDPHVLHVDLHRLSRFRLFEQPHLAGFPLAGPAQAGHPDVPKHPLNRAHGEPDPMHALQPEARPSGPVAELLPGVADQLDSRGRHLARPVPRIGRHQPLDATAPKSYSYLATAPGCVK